MAISKTQMSIARKRTKELKSHAPKAIAAGIDRAREMLVIELDSGAFFGVPTASVQGLAGAHLAQLSVIEISPSGYGLHFPNVDADVYLPSLMEGVVGTKAWMAERGRKGGQSTSAAKKAAAQANGRMGGRPPKMRNGAEIA